MAITVNMHLRDSAHFSIHELAGCTTITMEDGAANVVTLFSDRDHLRHLLEQVVWELTPIELVPDDNGDELLWKHLASRVDSGELA